MKACPEHREALALLALENPESVASATLSAIQQHLTQCAGCRSHLENLRATSVQVRQLPADVPEVPLPAGFHERLRARLRASASESESEAKAVPPPATRTRGTLTEWLRERWPTFPLSFNPRFAWAMACGVLVITAIIWFQRDRSKIEPGQGIVSVPPEGSPRPGDNRNPITAPDPVAALGDRPPSLMILSRALNNSFDTLDELLARQETLLAANDPPMRAMTQ
jgi:hypothetical protein